MEVSFTGINNVRIFKKSYQKMGSYLSNDSTVKQGNKQYLDVLIQCDLTDDTLGKDLTEFKETLQKCRPCYQVNCVNAKQPNHVSLMSSTSLVKDTFGVVSNSTFKINNYDIMLDERQILPMYSFMAHLTRKISQLADLSPQKQQCANFVNKAIDKEAVNFIEKL